jgi:hypothetical protein
LSDFRLAGRKRGKKAVVPDYRILTKKKEFFKSEKNRIRNRGRVPGSLRPRGQTPRAAPGAARGPSPGLRGPFTDPSRTFPAGGKNPFAFPDDPRNSPDFPWGRAPVFFRRVPGPAPTRARADPRNGAFRKPYLFRTCFSPFPPAPENNPRKRPETAPDNPRKSPDGSPEDPPTSPLRTKSRKML